MLVVDKNVQGMPHLTVPPRLKVIFCTAETLDLLPKPLIDWALKTATGQRNNRSTLSLVERFGNRSTITIQMAYTFTEILQHIPIKGLLQASAYDDWPSLLEQKDVNRIVEAAKTWGAAGIRVEGIDGLTYGETNEFHQCRGGSDNNRQQGRYRYSLR